MRRGLAIVALLVGWAGVAHGRPEIATIIKDMKAALEPARPSVRELTLEISTPDGDVTVWTAAQARKVVNGQQQMLTVVLADELLRGNAWLVREGLKGAPDLEWVYEPATRRIKELVPVLANDGFVGSDFTFTDLGFEKLHARYALLGTENVYGMPTYKLEATPAKTPGNWLYGRILTWVDAETMLPVQRELYDLSNKLYKVQFFERVERIDGVPTILRTRIENRQTGDRSEISVTGIRYDVEIPDSLFGLKNLPTAATAEVLRVDKLADSAPNPQ